MKTKRVTFFLGLCALGALANACGDNHASDATVKIINGDVVNATDRVSTHVVAFGDDEKLMCTGTLISADSVLIAAHCVEYDIYLQKKVMFGVGLVDNAQVVSVSFTRKMNPNFHWDPSGYSIGDLAVLKIDPKLVPSYMVPAKLLAPTEAREKGQKVVLAGYGLVRDEKSPDGNRQNTERKLYSTTSAIDMVDKERGLIFYQSENKLNSACNGDSGGPMFVEKDGDLSIIGVVRGPDLQSPDSRACRGRGTYTDIAPNYDWIMQQ